MVDENTDGGHCKDIGHVRVVVVARIDGAEPGYVAATFLPTVSCVNVPDYHGWAVQLVKGANTPNPQPGLRLLPPLAEVFPTWLRRARRTAIRMSAAVQIEHTFDTEWVPFIVLSPDAAKALARSVTRALEQAPAGEFG